MHARRVPPGTVLGAICQVLSRAVSLANLRVPNVGTPPRAVEAFEAVGRRDPRALRARGPAREPADVEQAQARSTTRRAANLRGAQEALRARQRRAHEARRHA